MFVSKKSYNQMEQTCALLYKRLIQWQDGYEELEQRLADAQKSQISTDDLKRLRRLCHPDRHGNSTASNEMTAKLNKLLATD